jgi:hypothetical protein
MPSKQQAWTYLADLDPDVALLQEVGDIPASFREQYSVLHHPARGQTGRPQRFGSALLVRHGPLTEFALVAPLPWVNDELARVGGHCDDARLGFNRAVRQHPVPPRHDPQR